MRLNLWRGSIAVAVGFGLLSCSDAPTDLKSVPSGLRADITPPPPRPQIVISQVYGGGGNSGATYTHDYVELFNPGTASVDVSGWRIQYTSAAGNTWSSNVTTLPAAASIASGQYYLVRMATNNAAVGTALPLADAIGTTNMSGTAGKVLLTGSGVAPGAVACPTGSGIVDHVGYGATSNCSTEWGGRTTDVSSTTAAIRKNGGCTYSASVLDDFTVAAPTPRNSANATHICPEIVGQPDTVGVAPVAASISIGSTQTFTATARDAGRNEVGTTFTWTSSNTDVATVNASGVATAVTAGAATITATASNGVSGGATLTVTVPSTADVVISQIYGGGGNSGAQYTNDYIELFNRGTDPADVTGWAVQYTGATGTSWQSTVLSGTIPPGHYYLVREAAGAGTPAALPTPDALGTIAMGAGAGKVVVTSSGAAPTGACPTGGAVVDHVGYGTTSNCAAEWNGTTATLTNTTAAFRKNDGCIKTGSVTDDFIALLPNPHNSASPIKHCDGEPPRAQSSATIVINELMADPANAESASWGEWFEVHNYGTVPVNLNGWTIISGGTSQPNHTISTDVIVPAGNFAVLGRGADGERNGGVTLDYNYFVGTATTIWLDDSDYLMLVDTDNARADSVAWTSMPHGVTRALRNASLPHSDVNGTAWGYSTTVFGAGDYGTPDAENGALADVAPIVSANKITVSGRISTDAPLPVGFESQLFASEATAGGVNIPTTFTWTALTPDIATIDERGVIRALSAGTARFQVVAQDGTARVHTLSMVTPVASTTAQYLDNAAFGEPTDDSPSDDFIIHRPQYTTSFNGSRGIPNWVAYDLNGTDIVAGQDRCNCFTFDPELEAAGFTRYNTADYTGAGTFAGYGIDRGHMVRSFDRTAGTLDNARTFYFSNVVPQAADLNQGPWANMENDLGALAQSGAKEVYIYAGPADSIGTVKNEGRITIPKYTWKIALIMPRGEGLANVHDYRDLEVIAAVMPNVPNIRNADWKTSYVVTADSVEKLTGYHFLSLLSARTQRALKTGTEPPLGNVNGPFSSSEGSAVSMSAAASLDPNGTITSYEWKFGDGGVASGASVSHTYAHYGSYQVSMVVTDNDGLVDTVSTSTSVANVAPVVLSFDGATLLLGEAYGTSGSFTDPGVDTWSATVNYGDGSGPNPLALDGKTFSLSHTYATTGRFPVTVSVFDGDATRSGTQSVTVISAGEGVASLSDLVNQLIARGVLSDGNGNSLRSKLDAASNQLARGDGPAATNQLRAFSNEVSALLKSGRLGSTQAKGLQSLASRIILSVGN